MLVQEFCFLPTLDKKEPGICVITNLNIVFSLNEVMSEWIRFSLNGQENKDKKNKAGPILSFYTVIKLRYFFPSFFHNKTQVLDSKLSHGT